MQAHTLAHAIATSDPFNAARAAMSRLALTCRWLRRRFRHVEDETATQDARSMQRMQPCPGSRSRAGGSGVDSGMWKMRSSGDEQPSVDGNHDVNGDSNGMEVVLCDACKMLLPSNEQLEQHQNSKKHRKHLRSRMMQDAYGRGIARGHLQ